MLSYVARAFCSAAKSSTKSVIGSADTAIVAALHGTPEASTGYTPLLWSIKYCDRGLFSICVVVAFFASCRTSVPTISKCASSSVPTSCV